MACVHTLIDEVNTSEVSHNYRYTQGSPTLFDFFPSPLSGGCGYNTAVWNDGTSWQSKKLCRVSAPWMNLALEKVERLHIFIFSFVYLHKDMLHLNFVGGDSFGSSEEL